MNHSIFACIRFTHILLFAAGLASCKKQDDFLNAKPDISLATISTLDDAQLLLNNEELFNRAHDPALGEISSDDFYLPNSAWQSSSFIEQNTYIWANQVYPANTNANDWSVPYSQAYCANAVLDALPSIQFSPVDQNKFNNIKGAAIFYRSYAFFNLLETFSLPFDSTTAGKNLGIPIRLNSDLNIKSVRSSIMSCYNQIISDLKGAIPLLTLTPTYPTQPSKAAAMGLLSRIYLSMGDYNDALTYCSNYLATNSSLVDYNTITPGPSRLISSGYFSEDIFHTSLNGYRAVFSKSISVVDSVLYSKYDSNDLRKSKFFIASSTGLPLFRGTYDFRGYTYSGIATDEIFLTRAECYARMGNSNSAMQDLNTLLATRWKAGTFTPYTASSADDALSKVLLERRKELLYRGIRWFDLRRLNKDSRFSVTLQRVINGVNYTLQPNDIKYALPIPDKEISLSGIAQNVR